MFTHTHTHTHTHVYMYKYFPEIVVMSKNQWTTSQFPLSKSGFHGEFVDSRTTQSKYKIGLGHLMGPENKEVVRKTKGCHHIKGH